MTSTITVIDTGLDVALIEVGIAGPAGAAGATGATGATGAAGADGTPGDTFLDRPIITPVLGSDFVPIVRGGVIYLATVADVLSAEGIDPAGSQLDFSTTTNSGLIPGVL